MSGYIFVYVIAMNSMTCSILSEETAREMSEAFPEDYIYFFQNEDS